MPEFVATGLRPALPRVVRVEQYAGADFLVKGEQPGNARVEAPHINTNAEVELQKTDEVSHRGLAKAEPLTKFRRIVFGLGPHIARHDGPLRRIVARPLDPEKIFKLHFGPDQIGQQAGRRIYRLVGARAEFPEPRHEIDINGLAAQERVDRRIVKTGQPLEFVRPDAALAFFDRNKRRPRDVNSGRGIGLRYAGRFAGNPQAFADIMRVQFTRAISRSPKAHRATNEREPRDPTKFFHSFACCVSSRSSFCRVSCSERSSDRLS